MTYNKSIIIHNIFYFMNLLKNFLYFQRPLVFVGDSDYYLLRNGESGAGIWTLIGQEDHLKSSHDNVPSIKEYMTYDEIKLAALLQVSSFVKPINSGFRENCGKYN